MLIEMDIRDLRIEFDLKIKGLLQVGSFNADEYAPFKEMGVSNFVFIDANPDVIPSLQSTLGEDCIILNYLISDKDNEIYTFNIANHAQSSSILKFDKHTIYHPEYSNVVKTIQLSSITLDSLIIHEKLNMSLYNFLMMDIQGAEMMALRGFEKNLRYIDYIYTELNFDSMYEGCCLEPQFTQYLESKDYKLVSFFDTGYGWGDGLYIKQNLL
jgi:FkbM family methyltransferase